MRDRNFSAGPAVGPKTTATQAIPLAHAAIEFVPEVPVEKPVEVKSRKSHLEKLAYAVARHETGNCTLGYGKMYNNCFGIKNGNTKPCPMIGRNKMCIYEKPSDSYEAFYVIWTKVYGGGFPTLKQAQRWSGNDNARGWLKNVTTFYHQQ